MLPFFYTGKKGKSSGTDEETIPLFLLITVPVVAGVICLTFVLVCWRRHRKVTLFEIFFSNSARFGFRLCSYECQYTTSTNRALGVWAEIWGERISRHPLSQPGSI